MVSQTFPAANTTLNCYTCFVNDAVDDPKCLRPVARKAAVFPCPGTVGQNVYCVKFVMKTLERLNGQILKTWLMGRQCAGLALQQSLFGIPVKCGQCQRLSGSTRYYYRNRLTSLGIIPPPDAAEEIYLDHRSVCACCTDLCNAEEGFNLSRLGQQETAGAGYNKCTNLELAFFCSILSIFIIIAKGSMWILV